MSTNPALLATPAPSNVTAYRRVRIVLDGTKSHTVVGPDGLPVVAVEAYFRRLRLRDDSPNTLRRYAVDLGQWFTVLDAYGADWRTADRTHVDRYVAALRGERGPGALALGKTPEAGCSTSTIDGKLAVLTEFYRHHLHSLPGLGKSLRVALTGSGRTGSFSRVLSHLDDPQQRFGRRDRHNSLYLGSGRGEDLRYFTPQQVEGLYRAMPRLDPRDRFILTLALETGLRGGQMLCLKHCHMRTVQTNPAVKLAPVYDHPTGARIKSDDTRSILVDQRVVYAYNEYVHWLVDLGIDLTVEDLPNSFVLVNLKDPHRFQPMSYSALKDRIPTITKACPVPLPDWSWHMTRHTHATILLLSGVPMQTVQKRLGHAQITTTMDTYAHVTEEAALAALDGWNKYAPRVDFDGN